jgi:UDP:flavonoid glycosyltransferase YjiC (YdhE family)
LQCADAFITHGGMNSVHEGLYYGVPEIVVPHQMEQLLNAVRVKTVGAGILLGEKAPYGRVTAAELREALDKVLNDDTYRQKANHYGKSLKDAGGYQKAVELIEEFVGVAQLEYA